MLRDVWVAAVPIAAARRGKRRRRSRDLTRRDFSRRGPGGRRGFPGSVPVPPLPESLRALREECDVEFTRASGPGGQHRNRSETAVRLRHRPTGLVAQASERRSQYQNLRAALERLEEMLAARLRVRRPRVPTKKTRSAREKTLEAKHRRTAVKRARAKVDDVD
ncbi:MAG: peptide chain release factor-like protein [Myxococcales bacterium]|nr:peptide chain release factor-like protein [Myxococcales bacterium]